MGGTSTDVSTIVDGQESFTTAFEIEWGLPIQIPMIDIRTIGAGGGSIAWIDKGGMLRVGPAKRRRKTRPGLLRRGRRRGHRHRRQSRPGPHRSDNFLGGRMKLDVRAAEAAVNRWRRRSADAATPTALAIVRIANNNMVGALRSRPDRARPRSARFHALRLRRRRAAACVRADGGDGHPARHHAEPSRPVLGLRLHRRPTRASTVSARRS